MLFAPFAFYVVQQIWLSTAEMPACAPGLSNTPVGKFSGDNPIAMSRGGQQSSARVGFSYQTFNFGKSNKLFKFDNCGGVLNGG